MKKKKSKVVGRTALVNLPELDLFNIQAKIDTGAYSSAIHISKAKEEFINGHQVLSVSIYKNTHFSSEKGPFHFADYKMKKVKSSNGIIEERYVVKTYVSLYGKKVKTQFTLTNRNDMRFPILLGRKFLSNRFLVDVSLTH